MEVFAFHEELVAECERSSRSFGNIRTDDVSREADAALDTDSAARRAQNQQIESPNAAELIARTPSTCSASRVEG